MRDALAGWNAGIGRLQCRPTRLPVEIVDVQDGRNGRTAEKKTGERATGRGTGMERNRMASEAYGETEAGVVAE